MAKYGILIDYDWCTGCHSCEVACQMELGLPVGQYGIKIAELGPWEYAPDKWQLSYIPMFTNQCTLCGARVQKGKEPSCVQHCQAKCMKFGKLEELQKSLVDHPKQVLFALK
ncbi:MAG: 4Fe-4S dicluster domain-containing protein [Eubacteriales bacterium]